METYSEYLKATECEPDYHICPSCGKKHLNEDIELKHHYTMTQGNKVVDCYYFCSAECKINYYKP